MTPATHGVHVQKQSNQYSIIYLQICIHGDISVNHDNDINDQIKHLAQIIYIHCVYIYASRCIVQQTGIGYIVYGTPSLQNTHIYVERERQTDRQIDGQIDIQQTCIYAYIHTVLCIHAYQHTSLHTQMTFHSQAESPASEVESCMCIYIYTYTYIHEYIYMCVESI